MVLILWFVARGDLNKPEAPILEYKDFVAILLTALGVMIAIVTVFAAFGAIWGFDLLRRETHATAEKVARDKVDEILPSLVEQAVRFQMQGPNTQSGQDNSGDQADQIADEIAKGT
jgi:hypothetical protein